MESSAALRVCSDGYEVGSITESLGLEPTRWYLKGTPVSLQLPDTLRQHSVWLLQPSLDPSQSLEDHLERILEILEHRTAGVTSLIERGCSVEIVCSVSSESGQAGTVLSASLLRRLADQRIDVLLSLYPPESSLEPTDT